MTTRTEDIAAAIGTILTTAGLTVSTATAEPYSFQTFPGVVVDVGSENVQGLVGLGGYADWTLEVMVHIAALGTSPKLAPEATRKTAHAALYANRTLNGLAYDLNLVSVARSIDSDNPALGHAVLTYVIKYRIAEGSA